MFPKTRMRPANHSFVRSWAARDWACSGTEHVYIFEEAQPCVVPFRHRMSHQRKLVVGFALNLSSILFNDIIF